eukprot:scaffold579_cov146-Ochromonas_danica.AAC.3
METLKAGSPSLDHSTSQLKTTSALFSLVPPCSLLQFRLLLPRTPALRGQHFPLALLGLLSPSLFDYSFVCLEMVTVLASLLCLLRTTLLDRLQQLLHLPMPPPSPDAVLWLSKTLNSFDDNTDFNTNENQYLHGLFAPVEYEHFNVPTQIISGSIPRDLNGLFLRVGPNPLSHFSHQSRGYHWFDGHGMIHSVRIRDGEANYSNQWIKTPNFLLSKKYNQVIFPQLGEFRGPIGLAKLLILDPLISFAFNCSSIHQGTANTAFTFCGDRLFVGHESSLPFEIKWLPNNSFTSLGYYSFDNSLNYPMTAHSKIDHRDQVWYFNGYSADERRPPMIIGKASQDRLVKLFYVSNASRSFAHDMAVTHQYVVLIEPSIHFDKEGLLTGQYFRYHPKKPLRIAVLPKVGESSQEVRWFTFDRALAVMHVLNAWEEGNEIVLVCPAGDSFTGLDPRNASMMTSMTMMEFRINLSSGQTSVLPYEDPLAQAVEFPALHPLCFGYRARYGYAGAFHGIGFHTLVKMDLLKRQVVGSIDLPDGLVCGEPVAIAKAGWRGRSSSGVYLATFACNTVSGEGEWLVYDGESMSNTPILRLGLSGHRVPLGFHGIFLSEDMLLRHMRLNEM